MPGSGVYSYPWLKLLINDTSTTDNLSLTLRVNAVNEIHTMFDLTHGPVIR